ncbi:MAG: exodeoxyribonuclease VII large subunit [SAR202 cluster bacterium Io17-Chloro-G9]|nr:MAG: exodeoxyribonuclease VII large subunit [SAR202 cluster bacterium Io17-Chloro-G9]
MAVYTVAQVTAHLRQKLEADPLLADLWVLGEASNLRVSSAGHSYFTLKDEQSVLRCVMFKGQPGSDLLLEGASVSAHGRVTFYERGGTTDFMVDLAMPQGMGELSLELERLKLRLEQEGLFQESRKRPLPLFPAVVGVITSPSGSVFHDIQNVIQRRYPLVELLLAPTVVQGPDAAPSIVDALEQLNRDGKADVIIVARGGGSLEDLAAFNEEAVARAVYGSVIPVVSAVGHETDFTIIDYVADVRAPTPSVAAELVVPDGWALRLQIVELGTRSQRGFSFMLESNRDRVNRLAHDLEARLPDSISWRRRIDDLARVATTAMVNRLTLARTRVQSLDVQLGALDPLATLQRGFSVVQRVDNNQVVASKDQVVQGDGLTITVSDGVIPATVGAGKTRPSPVKKRRAVPQETGMRRLL